MKRTEFIKRTAVIATLGFPILGILSCSTEDPVTPGTGNPPPPSPKDCLANGASGTISNNHSHSLIVTKEDVSTGTEKTYPIQGNASHNHNITITTANFNTLKGNTSIEVSSTSGDGHTHSVIVECA